MKIIATSDLHEHRTKWSQLTKIAIQDKYDLILISGDIIPKEQGIVAQKSFLKSIRKEAEKIRKTGADIFLIPGNDDNQNLINKIDGAEQYGLWTNVSEKIVKKDGYEFIGMPYVPDYPFQYKYWCRRDTNHEIGIDPFQFGKPLLLNSKNAFESIPDYKKWLSERDSIQEALDKLAKNVQDMSRSIWLIHAPPFGVGLDTVRGGQLVGSSAVLKFIKKEQPLLSVHGHIHESPFVTGKWYCKIDKTVCINAGQTGEKLYYAVVVLEDEKIVSIGHNEFAA